VDKEVHRTVAEYRKKLEDLGITSEKIIVFGSHAHGRAGEDSGLDLLVVAKAFKDMDLWERMCLLGRARVGINRPMEILGLTPGELEKESPGSFIADEILEKGLVIA